MTPLKVLIPLDGSKLAEASLAYVSSLRALDEVELTLLSVVNELEEVQMLDIQEAHERERGVLTGYLRDVATGMSKHLGLHPHSRVSYGAPADQIIAAARAGEHDLIVISTHGRTGPSRWRLGSVADKVIRGAPCNVMVMGPKAAQNAEWFAEVKEPFKKVVVPLDGSHLSEEAIPVAMRFAARYGSVLHFVRAVTVPMYGDISGDIAYPDLMDVMEDTANRYLSAIQARPGIPAGTVAKVLIGPPAAELLSYVDKTNADLVVMTSHGRGGFSRAALGSVTDRLLGSGAPVLVVKPAETGNEA